MEGSHGQVVAPSARRWQYAASSQEFLSRSDNYILAEITRSSWYGIETTQRDAWLCEITILRRTLARLAVPAWLAIEFSIPRIGRRIDAVLVVRHTVLVVEFKVGESQFRAEAKEQVWDYSLDLKNFHSESHDALVTPILVATAAPTPANDQPILIDRDRVCRPMLASEASLPALAGRILDETSGTPIDPLAWAEGRYTPTPTIVEAATALYRGHRVEAISRTEAGTANLAQTTATIDKIIRESRRYGRKSICFVTGVPGAGKTLVGLNVATSHMQQGTDTHTVFLSGNGPLVAVLREALAQDRVAGDQEAGKGTRLKDARREIEAAVQNVHHFRDACLDDPRPPHDHVALFDEAQRAWDLTQTAKFMRQKRGIRQFAKSEPEFLISCMDRHTDWSVIVCLVGGGQEINTGEAGIGEWIRALCDSLTHWHVYLSPHLRDAEFSVGGALTRLNGRQGVHHEPSLHLSVSMRSFRAEQLSAFVKQVLDREPSRAMQTLDSLRARYPIVLTRCIEAARAWLREQARGSERCGLVVSSRAMRLKPLAIDVRAPLDPVQWFLKPRYDVRSSDYLEDAATEFDVQGLELDWVGVVWDADFRADPEGWGCWSFRGDRWMRINVPERRAFLKNAYRVLLTRARQGMVIVVPEGQQNDPTRAGALYDPTYDYLRSLGLNRL